MRSNGGERFIQAKTITLAQPKTTYQGQIGTSTQIGNSDSSQWYRFRLNQRSSLDLHSKGALKGAEVDLVADRNGDHWLSRNEIIARSSEQTPTLQANALEQGTYFLRVTPNATDGDGKSFKLVLSTGSPRYEASPHAPSPLRKTSGILNTLFGRRNGSSGAVSSFRLSSMRWKADFLNRNASNITDYKNFNFTDPDATKTLGRRGNRGNVIARLNINYGDQSPASGIQADNFAMQAATRIQLKAGNFYRLSSNADDGTRFFFYDRTTGKTLMALDGNWNNQGNSTSDWTQTISVTESGRYDFFVQYYDRSNKAALDVKLEKIAPVGRISNSSGLYLRSVPSSENNTPIVGLDPGTTFKILRQVNSNDPKYPSWYEVMTSDGKQGYVAAGPGMVEMSDGSSIASLSKQGGSIINNPPNGNNGNGNNNNNNGNGGNSGGTGGYPYPYPGGSGSSGGKSGYTFTTNIPRDSGTYKPHLQEILSPSYYNTSYKPLIEQISNQYSWLQPSVVAAIGSRESAWGLLLSPKGPSGTGDQGHGRGLMQIDDRFHQQFINSGKWRDPKENIAYGISQVLAPNYNQLAQSTNLQGVELLRATLASYNAGLGNVQAAIREGRDPDYYTTGRDYGRDVLNRAGWFQLNGWA